MQGVSRILVSLAVVVASFWACLPKALAGTTPLASLNCDANGDGAWDLSDAVHILTGLFVDVSIQPVAFDCLTPPTLENGDCNGDGSRDLSDAVHLLTGLFTDPSVLPAPLVCPEDVTIYAGALTQTPGDWNYLAMQGLNGAIAACEKNFPGSSVCTIEKLLEAEAAGDFAAVLLDTGGTPVTSFWAHNPAAPIDSQCRGAASNVPWTYATGHLGVAGDYVDVDGSTGTLSPLKINLGSRCNDIHWVPCCNE